MLETVHTAFQKPVVIHINTNKETGEYGINYQGIALLIVPYVKVLENSANGICQSVLLRKVQQENLL